MVYLLKLESVVPYRSVRLVQESEVKTGKQIDHHLSTFTFSLVYTQKFLIVLRIFDSRREAVV